VYWKSSKKWGGYVLKIQHVLVTLKTNILQYIKPLFIT
jgi:hypothetical protein